MLVSALAIVVGGIILAVGAEYLVRGTVGLSRSLGVPAMVVAMSVLAFGTSLPELLISARAAARDSMGIALGNIVGSNIANILFILGVTALVQPILCQGHGLKRDMVALLAVTALFCAAAVNPGAVIARWMGGVLLAALGLYVWVRYAMARRGQAEDDPLSEMPEALPGSTARLGVVTGAALLGVLAGAELFVRGAEGIALALGISEAVIGLTVVALGTSLPELATGVAAARQKRSSVMVGGVIGSNLFNIMAAMGVAALVAPITVPARIQGSGLAVMVAATLAIAVLALWGGKISRWLGGLFLVAYGLFVVAQALGEGGVLPAAAAG